MKLYEFEGEAIYNKVGINTAQFIVASNLDEVHQARKRLKFPIVAKVQVLSGRRGMSGGIKICTNEKQLLAYCKSMFGHEFLPAGRQVNGETVRFISLVEKIKIEEEFYVSITYDTASRLPFLLFSRQGGVDIEEIAKTSPQSIVRLDIDPITGPKEKELLKNFGKDLTDLFLRLWDAFVRYDCRLVEVNPIARVGKELFAIDAKVILDDNGLSRHRDLEILPKGAVSAIPTVRELEAKKIDAEDYRGSAGSTFIELAGDIAILASGGGASLLVMDAVIAAGGRCANYTE